MIDMPDVMSPGRSFIQHTDE